MMLSAAILCSVPVAAEEPAPEVVVVEAPPSDPTDLTAQVTVVVVEDLPHSADVATAVQRAPGTIVQRLGGLGDLAQVGIRGSGTRHVEVLLDGIPLNPEGGSAINLAELPLRAFKQVEVYRGAPPTLLGTGAMGGTIQLVTGDPTLAATASVGSWRTARLTALASVTTGPVEGWFTVDGLTTSGRFHWYDDGNTRTLQDDDVERRRRNNDTDQLATVARLRVSSPVRLSVLHTALVRSEGLPGPAFGEPTDAVRFGVHRHLGAIQAEGAGGSLQWSARAHGLFREETLEDPLGEIQVGQIRSIRSRTTSVGARGAVQAIVSPDIRIDTAVDAQHDRFVSLDQRTDTTLDRSFRTIGRGALSTRWQARPNLAIVPALRGLLGGATSEALVLPSVGARWESHPTVAWKANLGVAARAPDPLETFGDRGSLVGNAALRAERSTSADIGVRASSAVVQAEAVGFARRVRNLIVWLPLPTGVSRAENLDHAWVAGIEGAVAATFGPFGASSSCTFTRAFEPDKPSTQVPNVPLWTGRAAVSFTHRVVQASTDIAGSSNTYTDPLNLQPPLGPRAVWGATLGLTTPDDRLGIELDVRNLLDQTVVQVPRDGSATTARVPAAMVDVSGYPLPGRTWLLSIRARH